MKNTHLIEDLWVDIETLKITNNALIAFLTPEQISIFIEYCDKEKEKLLDRQAHLNIPDKCPKGLIYQNISMLELSKRSENPLICAGINYVFELVNKKSRDIKSLHGIGIKSFNEIVEVLNQFGLHFDMRIKIEKKE